MKRVLSIFALLFCFSLSLGFSSCSDDDEMDSVDLMIERLQNLKFDDVYVYIDGEEAFSGEAKLVAGYEKPFIVFRSSPSASPQYFNLAYLTRYITRDNTSGYYKRVELHLYFAHGCQ